MKRVLSLFLLAPLLLFTVACQHNATPGTPTAPTPPQIKISSALLTLSENMNAASTALVTAYQQGKVSRDDLQLARNIMDQIRTVSKAINAELISADTWEVQKLKILKITTDAGVSVAVQKLPPTASAILAASFTLYNQIAVLVGGPTL